MSSQTNTIQLTKPQKKIARDESQFRVVNWGRRGGKTFLAKEEMIACAVSPSSSSGHEVYEKRVLYMAPQKNQAVDIMWEPLKQRLADTAVFKDKSEKKNQIVVNTTNEDKGLIKIRGWDKVEKVRGQAFDLIVLDEVADMSKWGAGWNGVIRPMLLDTGGKVLFISTPKGYNHFYELYEAAGSDTQSEDSDLPAGSTERFHFTTYDNPHIDEEKIESDRQSMPKNKFAQEYLGEFKKMEGLVYPQFKRNLHIKKDHQVPNSFAEVIAGVDFGYRNPTAIPVFGVDEDRNYWVIDEIYELELTAREIAEKAKQLQEKHSIRYFYPDSEAPEKIKELQNDGLTCRTVEKDLENIDKIREMFLANRIRVHERCSNFINELEQYRYPEQSRDKNKKEKPLKKNDHLCFVGNTRVLTLDGEKKIREVSTEDKVLTREGWKNVLVSAKTGKSDIMRVSLSNGRELEVTPNHPIWTKDNGWVKAKKLEIKSELLCPKNLKEKNTTREREDTTVSVGRMKQPTFIEKFGKNTMVRYLKDITSTILTAIQRITTLITLSVLTPKNTLKNTEIAVGGNQKNIKRKQLKRQKSGTQAKKVKNGTANTGKKLGTENLKKKIVNSAGRILSITLQQNTALLPANKSITVEQIDMLDREEEVYNLMVEDCHEYFANGVLVSNCDAMRYALAHYEPTSGSKPQKSNLGGLKNLSRPSPSKGLGGQGGSSSFE